MIRHCESTADLPIPRQDRRVVDDCFSLRPAYGCFWHGCPKHATWPKTRAAFWRAKITGNMARDRRVNRILKAEGWTVVRVWEHELTRRNEPKLIRRLNRVLGRSA
jgi:G:T-mismatch repair DNA endonuclease (very short patch repair protein)